MKCDKVPWPRGLEVEVLVQVIQGHTLPTLGDSSYLFQLPVAPSQLV